MKADPPPREDGGLFSADVRGPISIVFPPIILSKVIYDRLFGRAAADARRCACACVRRRACLDLDRKLPADGAAG